MYAETASPPGAFTAAVPVAAVALAELIVEPIADKFPAASAIACGVACTCDMSRLPGAAKDCRRMVSRLGIDILGATRKKRGRACAKCQPQRRVGGLTRTLAGEA